MRILNTRRRLKIALTIGGIVLLTGLAGMVLLYNGRTKAPEKSLIKQEKTTKNLDDDAASPDRKTITIHLPRLSEHAKKSEMVLIKPGSFVMGSQKNERGRYDNEWPPHEVTITRAFYMGKYEVTQAQWEAVLGRKSYRSRYFGKPNHPVEKVSWMKCRKFIKKLNTLGLGSFRLPTEAEWEYACRAGTEERFSFGNALECVDEGSQYCEIADKYMWWGGNNDPKGTKEVGLKLPNPWGLYDMHGNVQEWCSDGWEEPYEREPQKNPKGSSGGILIFFTHRVFRGGSFLDKNLRNCRSARRSFELALDFHFSLGLRLVREVADQK